MTETKALGKKPPDEEFMTFKCVFCGESGGAIGDDMIHSKCVNRHGEQEAFENGKAIGRDECLFSNCEKCGEPATVRVCNKCFAIERQAGREEGK